MTTGENDRNVEELNQGLGNMSLNSGKKTGWEGLTQGYKSGDGSRREWATWCGNKTDDVTQTDNAFKLYDAIDSDDEILTDEYDSDDSQKSHDSRKKHPYFVQLFESLDELTADQIHEPVRQWHCPACRDGPGSIHWFRGMKAFVTHIKTKGSRRPHLHRYLAELLDEELCRRGAVAAQNGQVFGRWFGVEKDVGDWKIVWPPMVVVQNTLLEVDENEKWLGIGTQELLEYFDSFEAVKARNAFGPDGHRGVSVLIFDASAVGYLEAERLGKHFERQDIGRYAWNDHPVHFSSDGMRQLYGYLATEQDLEAFNLHSPGKLKLKFELVSYQEKVVNQYQQLSKDSQQLIWYKKMIAKQELCRRGAVAVQNGQVFGRWVGVEKDVGDWKIVWPPMVVVQNTLLEVDENEKWLGMGSQELLDYFDSFEAVKARNAFGPDGHRGMSVLIFDASAVGYLEAERLGKHFERQDIGRHAWNDHPVHFSSDGKRQLYGYVATEQDLEVFNLHSPGKLKLKFELVSYQEKVVNQYKQLSKDSQQLIWYKKMIAKQERSSKALEDAFLLLSEKLRKMEEANKIIRQRTLMYHEQNEEAMDFLEKFSIDQEECKTVHAIADAPQRNEKVGGKGKV